MLWTSGGCVWTNPGALWTTLGKTKNLEIDPRNPLWR